MRGLWPLLLPTFAAGFGVAWWLKPEPPPVEAGIEAASPKVVPRRPGADTGVREQVVTADTVLDALADLRHRDEEFAKELGALEPDEIPALLSALRDRAGYFGLGHADEDVLKKLVVRWYDGAPEEALLWVMSLESEEDRQSLLREVVNHEADRDFDAALALARRVSPGDDDPFRFLDRLQQKAAELGPDKLLQLARLSVGKTGVSSGFGPTYPPDFDFRKMLDGLAELHESLGEGEKITSVPANLLEEWARRDPQAAFEWVSQGGEAPFNEMTDFIEGYAEVGGDREVGRLVGEIFKPEEPHAYTRYALAAEALVAAPQPETLEGFLEAAGVAASRETHLAGLLDRSNVGWGKGYDQARRVIVEAMTPEQRLRLIPASSLSANMRQQLIPELRRLGHTDAEIAAMTSSSDE